MVYFMGCMFFSNFSCQPYVINIQLRNTDNICTDLYILLKPQSELGYLGLYRVYKKKLNKPKIAHRLCIAPQCTKFFIEIGCLGTDNVVKTEKLRNLKF